MLYKSKSHYIKRYGKPFHTEQEHSTDLLECRFLLPDGGYLKVYFSVDDNMSFTEYWYDSKDRRHRLDGPAAVVEASFYIHGKYLTFLEYFEHIDDNNVKKDLIEKYL